MRPRRLLAALASALTLAVVAAGCGGGGFDNGNGGGGGGEGGGSKGKLTVGSAGFTESEVLAQMYKQLLDAAGYTASVTTLQNREIYEPALEKGEIDVVPEYAATMAEFLNHKKNGPDAKSVASPDLQQTMGHLRDLASAYGLKVLQPSKAVDQNAFAVTQEFAAKHNLKTLSDLGRSGIPVKFATSAECSDRPFCAPGLEKTYGIEIAKMDPLGVDTPQVKQAVQKGKDQLGLVLTTDGTLADFGLVVLEDDKHLQNADYVVPVVNAESAGSAAVAEALNKLAPVLTTRDLAELNKRVDQDREKPEQVAADYLKSKGLA